MSNRKHYHKITPQIDKEIKAIVTELPKLHRVNNKGEIIYQPRSKRVGWEELNEMDQEKFILQEIKKCGKLPEDCREEIVKRLSEKGYISHWGVPLEINHYINLIQQYKEKGQAGVITYVEKVNSITRASEQAAEEMKNKQAENAVQ